MAFLQDVNNVATTYSLFQRTVHLHLNTSVWLRLNSQDYLDNISKIADIKRPGQVHTCSPN